ncbi:DoxX family protein [Euzebyella saccharophila]|uniref:DoxX family membrane protein n=1 Tax=Euzebyella saccharophila TaxID=679664 RepID=A0ABV8JVK4_9FLAO|nr:hypothetical protein [Euzebyella saccharophila]
MKPLIVLLSVFIITVLILKMIHGTDNFPLAGRIAMSVMLIFTAIGHHVYTKGMVMMIPNPIPYKVELIYLTAGLQILAAVTLIIPRFTVITGWLLIAFFLLLFPANIKAAFEHINYETAQYDGKGPEYLWIRIPLQILFIIWVYICAIKPFSIRIP